MQFLDTHKATLFSVLHICKQRSIANDRKLNSRYEVISKRRQKNALLEVFGIGQFLVSLIFPAPALKPQKMLIAPILDLFLPSIGLLGDAASK